MKRLTIAAVLAACFAMPAAARDELERGKYLAEIMDCGGCHTPGVFFGKPDFSRPLAGSEVGFQIPGLGIFYPRNLTPDTETGIGSWSEEEIVAAIRTGARPDGRLLVPIMPWKSYASLSDADATALAKYLKTLKPVKNVVPAITGASEKPAAPYFTIVVP